MCDFSLHHVKSRPAKVGDRFTTHDFGRGTRGFAASEDANTAVCILPGTELSFDAEGPVPAPRSVWVAHENSQLQDCHLSANQQGQGSSSS